MDPRIPLDDIERLVGKLRSLEDRINKLEAPAGTSVFRTVDELRLLVTNIQAQLDAYNASRYTNAQIDSRVTNPGLVGNVASTGSAQFTSLRADGGLASTDVYSHLVTGGGLYRATWTHESGFLGYAPSSRRFKTDIEDFDIDLDMIDDLRVRRFHYMASVPYDQAQQPWTTGLIAEEVEALGMPWLIDYDDQGKPFGIRYELLALALIPALQRANARVAKQGFKEVSLTLASFSVLGNVRDVQITWPEPFADANYSVTLSIAPPAGLLTAMGAVEIPDTRTAAGVKVRVTTNGIALNSGAILKATGLHL